LLLWSHIGLLALILMGFGGASVWLAWRGTIRQAEADLFGAAQLLVRELAENQPPATLKISETYFHRFGPAPRDQAWLAVWNPDGRLVASSAALPEHAVRVESTLPNKGPRPFVARRAGLHLDVIVPTEDGGQLLIGRPLAKEFDDLQILARHLGLSAVIAVALGSVAAMWLARRIAAPMERIADTAATMTFRSLSQRLQEQGGSREVVRLATAFNAMLSRLDESFRMQTRFTADASHELRTPVSIVLAQADLTLSRDRSPEEYREALRTCLQTAKSMGSLIDALLLLARADAHQLVKHRERIDLHRLAQSRVESLRAFAASRSVSLEVSGVAAFVIGDALRLDEVVSNLVTNAVLYNVASGHVHVDVQQDARETLLTVRDDGIGIPSDDQPRIFDRFYRVDRARSRSDEFGTGLGLSLVAEIVAAHGGSVQVESSPGAGTTMTVRLPTDE
jgi:heavy metal sensor kinase